MRGRVGSCATSATIWVSSLYNNKQMRHEFEVSNGHLLNFVRNLVHVDAAVGCHL